MVVIYLVLSLRVVMAVPLYYYTSLDNFECINQLGLIWTSLGIGGYGVYLTEIPPNQGRLTVEDSLYKNRRDKYLMTEVCLETNSSLISAEKLIAYPEDKIWKSKTQLGLASFYFQYIATSDLNWKRTEVKNFIKIEHLKFNPYNKSPISQLQEMVVRSGIQPNYTESFDGTRFVCTVSVASASAEGSGSSKQIAKTEAAKNLLRRLIVGPSENSSPERRHVYLNEENNIVVSVSLNNDEAALCDSVDSMSIYDTKPDISKSTDYHLPVDNEELIPKLEAKSQIPSHISEINFNPVSKLEEFCIINSLPAPTYNSSAENNALVNNFTITVTVGDVVCEGTGWAKKLAKRAAAQNMLRKLGVFSPSEGGDQHVGRTSVPESIGDVIEVQSYSTISPQVSNPIGKLQEFCVAKGWKMPDYGEVSEGGVPHAKTFTIRCTLEGHSEYGTGSSKKEAKHIAASKMWKKVTVS